MAFKTRRDRLPFETRSSPNIFIAASQLLAPIITFRPAAE